jgi:hypothetical protein
MLTASNLRTNSDNIRINLTYIESIIKSASDQGLYHVTIDNQYMDDNMCQNLINNGYSVSKREGLLGDPQGSDYFSYIIGW